MKKLSKILGLVVLGAFALENLVGAAQFNIENRTTVTEVYEGVTHTHLRTVKQDGNVYGNANVNVLEIDFSNKNLYVDVVGGGEYANELKTVAKTCENFNNNDEGKTAIAAVNGDLWMVAYAHARYEGSATGNYKNYPVVVKKGMTVPRGLNIRDGEIITTAHMQQETPFEGSFSALGITDDYEFIMGSPTVNVKLYSGNGTFKTAIDGVNRLPADKAIVLYTDKGLSGNDYSLDDAYEILVETDGDYKLAHGCEITGTVKAIYDKNTSENAPKLAENQFMITARGDSKTELVSEFKVGQQIKITAEIRASGSAAKKWTKVQDTVGGHIQIVRNGKVTGEWAGANYPSTIVGFTKDGKLVLITFDGRQKGFSEGPTQESLAQLVEDTNLYNAFNVDGGGSTTMVIRNDSTGKYDVVNSPSDSGNTARTVVNSIVISYGPAREDASDDTTADTTPADTTVSGSDSTSAPADTTDPTDPDDSDTTAAPDTDTDSGDSGTDAPTEAGSTGTPSEDPGTEGQTTADVDSDGEKDSSPLIITAAVAAAVVVIGATAAFIIIAKKKKS